MIGFLRSLLPWTPGGARAAHYVMFAAGLGASVAPNFVSQSLSPKTAISTQWLPNPAVAPVPASVRDVKPSLGAGSAEAGAWYVKDVYITYGNGYRQDFSAVINAEGDKYHIMPLFVAAVMFTESAGYVDAERWGSGLDQSCGLFQVILANVQAYNGLYGRAACNWEETPANSIEFGARMLSECYYQHQGRVPIPQIYVGYNAGCAQPEWFLLNPTYGTQAYSNYWQNLWPNWEYALAHYVGGAPTPPAPPTPRPTPKPRAFNVAGFESWMRAHHRHDVPYRDSRHQLTWQASVYSVHPTLDGYIRARWLTRFRVDKYVYARGVAYAWPRFHRYKVVLGRRSK